MGDFIHGVVEANIFGATPEADHILLLRHASGTVLTIFGPPDLCQDLLVGDESELILRATLFASPQQSPEDSLRYYDTAPDDDYPDWQCTIRALQWNAVNDCCARARPGLFQGHWLLAMSDYGDLLIRSRIHRAVGVNLRADGILRFGGCRLDLYGVAFSNQPSAFS